MPVINLNDHERLTTTVVLYEGTESEMPGWPGEMKVVEFILWLNGVLANYPEKYLDTASMKIESVGGWEGEHHAELKITIERPETDAEMIARLNAEQRARTVTYRQELATYERLKTMFEPKEEP